jgi:hypothetical protein
MIPSLNGVARLKRLLFEVSANASSTIVFAAHFIIPGGAAASAR